MIPEIVKFLLHYTTYKSEEKLTKKVEGHLKYKTCRIVYDSRKEICAVCFWNISEDGQTADVTDLIIREDFRKQNMMRLILQDGLKVWNVKYLSYVRDYTEDGHDRGPRKNISVERFLRRNV